jgi:hypothetical protein
MNFEELRQRTCASLFLLLPEAGDSSRLVDECLSSARLSFRDEFILRLSPEAWARISLTYATTFLDSGTELSVGEIGAAVLRDAININRLDMLAQQLAQSKKGEQTGTSASPPKLTVIKS